MMRPLQATLAADSRATGMMNNHLLARLPHSERDQVTAQCEAVNIACGDVLCAQGVPCRYAYFPLSGFVSLVVNTGERQTLGIGLVGNEGMLGATLALGAPALPAQGQVLGAGSALRMPAERFAHNLQHWPALQETVNRYLSVSMEQLSLTATCAHFHETEARLARWLLMAEDCAQGAPLHLTHEFLAGLLGVRRSSITIAAGALQRRELIGYTRGGVRIIDRVGLEAASCSCYRAALASYHKLLD